MSEAKSTIRARRPIPIPAGVVVEMDEQHIVVKGLSAVLSQKLSYDVSVVQEGDQLLISAKTPSRQARAMSGTLHALIRNMITGVTAGFERKLLLVGVGYRAQLQDNTLNLLLGLSHPVKFELPSGVTAHMPNPSEIVLKSALKQLLGQVCAKIRSYRPCEPYKGKGIRNENEVVVLKETKKK